MCLISSTKNNLTDYTVTSVLKPTCEYFTSSVWRRRVPTIYPLKTNTTVQPVVCFLLGSFCSSVPVESEECTGISLLETCPQDQDGSSEPGMSIAGSFAVVAVFPFAVPPADNLKVVGALETFLRSLRCSFSTEFCGAHSMGCCNAFVFSVKIKTNQCTMKIQIQQNPWAATSLSAPVGVNVFTVNVCSTGTDWIGAATPPSQLP